MGIAYVNDEKMLWICENCPIAASTIEIITRIDPYTFKTVEQYRVRFIDGKETAWYLLKWENV